MKHPEIEIQLTGQDGNVFVLLGIVLTTLKKAKLPKSEIDEFKKQAMSGDYDNFLQTCMEWFNIQ